MESLYKSAKKSLRSPKGAMQPPMLSTVIMNLSLRPPPKSNTVVEVAKRVFNEAKAFAPDPPP